MTTTPISWFEIPTRNIDAAVSFYEGALDSTLRREDNPHVKMAIFPYGDGVGGALCQGRGLEPRDHGAVVYLRVRDTKEATCARWTKAGGKLVSPIIELPDGIGRIAQVLDGEGGRVALHEPGSGAPPHEPRHMNLTSR